MYHQKRRYYSALIFFGFLAVFAGGCGEDPETPTIDEEEPTCTVTGHLLMPNYEQVYEGMLYEELGALLHPDFRFVLLEATIAGWENSSRPLDQYYFGIETMLQIHSNLFANLSGTDEVGEPVDPVESIQVLVLDKIGTWMEVDPSDEDFGGQGAYHNRYEVMIYFEQPGSMSFEVHQLVDYYVSQIDECWYILGLKAVVGLGLGSETISFDALLALYR